MYGKFETLYANYLFLEVSVLHVFLPYENKGPQLNALTKYRLVVDFIVQVYMAHALFLSFNASRTTVKYKIQLKLFKYYQKLNFTK